MIKLWKAQEGSRDLDLDITLVRQGREPCTLAACSVQRREH